MRSHPRHPCLWLTLPLAGCVEDFHLQVSAPCRAHKEKKTTPGRFLLWDLDFDTGAIKLVASNNTLAIDTQGQRISAETPAVLNAYDRNAASQKWDFISKPNFILSVSNPSLCLDNKGRSITDGNTVWLYPFNGSLAQEWALVPLSNFKLAD
ncbi:hypothetical protein CIW54_13130 [Paraburkholderia sp. T12-10]|nr:hypothetical protein CIW54_13130 [Paraburkholderia sp. T12-10]